MDAKQIKQLKPMLNKYLRQFDDCFGRIEPTERPKAYVTGIPEDIFPRLKAKSSSVSSVKQLLLHSPAL